MIKVRRVDPNNKHYESGMRFAIIINGEAQYFTEAALKELQKEIDLQLPPLVIVEDITQVSSIQIVKHNNVCIYSDCKLPTWGDLTLCKHHFINS